MKQHSAYAIDKNSNAIIHVSEVNRGLKCECYCHECNEPLVAKKGNKIGWHFAHSSNSECSGGLETVIHKLAKEALAKHKYIETGKFEINYKIPQRAKIYSRAADTRLLTFDQVELESPTYRHLGIIPDAVAVTAAGSMIIEFAFSHWIDDEKKSILRTLNVPTIEVDLNKINLSAERNEIEHYILKQAPRKMLWDGDLSVENIIINDTALFREHNITYANDGGKIIHKGQASTSEHYKCLYCDENLSYVGCYNSFRHDEDYYTNAQLAKNCKCYSAFYKLPEHVMFRFVCNVLCNSEFTIPTERIYNSEKRVVNIISAEISLLELDGMVFALDPYRYEKVYDYETEEYEKRNLTIRYNLIKCVCDDLNVFYVDISERKYNYSDEVKELCEANNVTIIKINKANLNYEFEYIKQHILKNGERMLVT